MHLAGGVAFTEQGEVILCNALPIIDQFDRLKATVCDTGNQLLGSCIQCIVEQFTDD